MNKQHKVTATFLANKTLGVRGVGHKLGIPPQTVSRLLKRSAIDVKAIRKQQTAQMRDKMCAFHGLGLTNSEIGDDMGYSADYVRKVVRGDLG